MRLHLRGWYLITVGVIPPLWASVDWRGYTHVGGRASGVAYVGLLVSPVLFALGARRLFDIPRPDAE